LLPLLALAFWLRRQIGNRIRSRECVEMSR